MKVFRNTLKEINGRLDLPQPARSRVLLEIASDLEDLYEYYRGQGLSARESQGMAIDQCNLSDEALAELVNIHTSILRRFLDRFSAQAQSHWERAFLIILLVVITTATGRLIVTTNVFTSAGPLVWVALGITFTAIVFSGTKFYLAYIKKDHDLRRLRAGLPTILVAGCINVFVGAAAGWYGLYEAVLRTMDNFEGFWLYVIEWTLESSSLLLICLAAALLTALLWFVLSNKIARIEQAEAAMLLVE